MQIFSKELLMGGGKKEEIFNLAIYADSSNPERDGYVEGGFPSWETGSLRIEHWKAWPDIILLSVSGTLGQGGSVIQTRKLATASIVNINAVYTRTFEVKGYKFHEYYNSSYINYYYVSPGQKIGDILLCYAFGTGFIEDKETTDYPYFYKNYPYIYRY